MHHFPQNYSDYLHYDFAITTQLLCTLPQYMQVRQGEACSK